MFIWVIFSYPTFCNIKVRVTQPIKRPEYCVPRGGKEPILKYSVSNRSCSMMKAESLARVAKQHQIIAT